MLVWCTFFCYLYFFFFFKQKTAYEMRISDWSSDVCSSDLRVVDDLAQRDRPALLLARPAQDAERDRAAVGGREENLRLALAGKRPGHMEGIAHAGDDRRRIGRHRVARDPARQRVRRDRKSTRLNSSH